MAIVIFIMIFFFFFFFVMMSATTSSSTKSLLQQVFEAQEFSNISTVYSTSTFEMIKADRSGENYLFGIRKDSYGFTSSNITTLYEVAQRSHIHSVVIVTYTPIGNASPIYRLIKNYNIDVWDYKKLLNLTESFDATTDTSYTDSVLQTSDTSDDTCKINTESYDPIQEGSPQTHSIFSGLFDRPEKL